MTLLTCEALAFAYENQMIVRDLSFQVEKGDYLCIVGENGTGKTTLMKGILGLKKPAEGHIKLGEGLKASEIGYVPQQNTTQKDFPASVWEVVLSGCLNRRGFYPGYGSKDKEKALNHLQLLGIENLKNKSYQDLSGGQRQRVLLARSLCATSKMLLLDEPTTGLDPVAATDFYKLMDKLNKEHKITIVMISHEIKKAITVADHILHLSHDEYFFGLTQTYLESKQGKQFLGNGGVEQC